MVLYVTGQNKPLKCLTPGIQSRVGSTVDAMAALVHANTLQLPPPSSVMYSDEREPVVHRSGFIRHR